MSTDSSGREPATNETPMLNILGEKVALGPLHRGVIPLLVKWDNDFEVSFLSGDPLQPTTRDSVEYYFEKEHKEFQENKVNFLIYERATTRPIGTTGLRRIEMRGRTATFGILIGEKDCWSKGYGTETTILMLDYGFNVLGLHNIMLTTYSYNERAIRAYTRAGFRLIGRRREGHRWGNKYYDDIMMDCLSTEFQNPFQPILNLP